MNSEKATYTGFEFEAEGYPALAIINSDLKKLENRSRYLYSVFIGIVPDTYNDLGHPVEAEYDYLNQVEKQIIEYLEQQTQTFHVGHTTLYRLREIIFYTRERERVESFLEHFLENIGRQSSFEIEEDPEWDNVSAFYDLI
jgi:hypothetical protein